MELLAEYCDQRDDLSREQLFYENAMRAYGLTENDTEHPGGGNGLFVSYWNGKAGGRGWWDDSINGCYAPTLDAYWVDSPAEGVNTSFWNARYTGELEPLVTGTHRLYLTIDDYARLWIDGKLVVDAWGGEYSKLCHSAQVDLVAGQRMDIQLEYANTMGDGFVRLEWEAEALLKEVIPESQLYNSVDTTSQTSSCPPRSMEDHIQIFPNPAKHELCIRSADNGLFEIYYQDGRKIDAFILSEDLTRRNTSDWKPGIYYLNIRCGSHLFTRKVISL